MTEKEVIHKKERFTFPRCRLCAWCAGFTSVTERRAAVGGVLKPQNDSASNAE